MRFIRPSRDSGQANRPRSRCLINRYNPSRSARHTLSSAPLFPRKTNRYLLTGSALRMFCTFDASPWKPHRISVTPATSQILLPAEKAIIGTSSSVRRTAFSAGSERWRNSALQCRTTSQHSALSGSNCVVRCEVNDSRPGTGINTRAEKAC